MGEAGRGAQWWRDAVVYQIYPRSFQDSDGDGEGDLPGLARRLEHVARLGADAIWLSPIYPSPMADGGYDVSDHSGVDPRFGTVEDVDALVAHAHALGLRVLLDVVPCHTSIEHPWFREHPEWYVWSDRDGPQNNWVASFGGSAWSRDADSGRWYLHSFYPEQPDLDWRHPGVRAAMRDVVRGWRARGVDGFRLDAIDRLLKDPALRDEPPASRPPELEEHPQAARLDHRHSRDAPGVEQALEVLRSAAGPDAFLVGEVYLPTDRLAPYLEHVDVAFAFELLQAPWSVPAVRRAIERSLADPALEGRIAWVLSNHDFSRLPDRVGPANVRAAAMLALTLPGPVFVYQGDELGAADGPGGEIAHDRYGRDRHRHPMCWDAEKPHGGFTDGTPWLPVVAPLGGGAAQQERDDDSVFALYRDLIAARSAITGGLRFLHVADGVLAYRRGAHHVVVLHFADGPRTVPVAGTIVRATHASRHPTGTRSPRVLEAGEGLVIRIT